NGDEPPISQRGRDQADLGAGRLCVVDRRRRGRVVLGREAPFGPISSSQCCGKWLGSRCYRVPTPAPLPPFYSCCTGGCPDRSGKTWRSYQACSSIVSPPRVIPSTTRMRSCGRSRNHSVKACDSHTASSSGIVVSGSVKTRTQPPMSCWWTLTLPDPLPEMCRVIGASPNRNRRIRLRKRMVRESSPPPPRPFQQHPPLPHIT